MKDIDSVSGLLHEISEANQNNSPVSLGDLLQTIGQRSFGPIILATGLFLAVPGVSDIPTVPTILGAVIFLIGIQIVLKNEHIWLPKFLLNRSIKSEKLEKSLRYLEKPANYLDKIIYHRFPSLTADTAYRVVALISIIVAGLTPLMELVPLSANVAGVIFVFFGLGLVGRDGLMNLLGILFCFCLAGILIYFLV